MQATTVKWHGIFYFVSLTERIQPDCSNALLQPVWKLIDHTMYGTTHKSGEASSCIMFIIDFPQMLLEDDTHADIMVQEAFGSRKTKLYCYFVKNNAFFPRSKHLNKPKNNFQASIFKRPQTKYYHHRGRPPEAHFHPSVVYHINC
jgi:hypothetical protein